MFRHVVTRHNHAHVAGGLREHGPHDALEKPNVVIPVGGGQRARPQRGGERDHVCLDGNAEMK